MTGSVFGAASTPVLSIFAVLLGLTFGSFSSVLVARVPTKKSLWTRSECTSCQKLIRASENIPVLSYLLLRGKCSNCQNSISAIYPILELVTAALFVAGVLTFHTWTSLSLWLILIIIGVPLTVIDITLHRLPDLLTAPLFLASAIVILLDAFVGHHFDRLIPSLVGALALPAFYIALMIISRGGMGMGDVKLSAGIGLVSGFFGVHIVLVSSFAAYILGSVIGIGLMLAGKAGRKTAIPFGPFMLVGQAIALVVAAHSVL